MSPRRVWHWAGSQAAGRVVLFGMLLQMVLVGLLYYQDRDTVRCQAAFNEANAKRTAELADSVTESRRALGRMIDASLTRDQGATYIAAAMAYKEALAKEEKERREHPPIEPKDFCGR